MVNPTRRSQENASQSAGSVCLLPHFSSFIGRLRLWSAEYRCQGRCQWLSEYYQSISSKTLSVIFILSPSKQDFDTAQWRSLNCPTSEKRIPWQVWAGRKKWIDDFHPHLLELNVVHQESILEVKDQWCRSNFRYFRRTWDLSTIGLVHEHLGLRAWAEWYPWEPLEYPSNGAEASYAGIDAFLHWCVLPRLLCVASDSNVDQRWSRRVQALNSMINSVCGLFSSGWY